MSVDGSMSSRLAGRTWVLIQSRAARLVLGFPSLQDYFADRAVTRRWPGTMIASELGVQPATVRA